MAEAESDVQLCDTSKSAEGEETIADEMTDGIVEETINNSSTFDFAERSWRTDFTLVVEGTRFYVAKNILALASPVFDKMFESDFKESNSDEIELPGKNAVDVNEFLRAIYPNTASVMSKENALKVLPLAEEYQVLNLKRRCEEGILVRIDALTSIEELYRLIKEAHLYNLKELIKRCVNFVCEKSVEEIERANRENLLPGEHLSSILQNVNDRLVARVKELELLNSHQAEQLETHKTQLREELEMYKTWTNYLSKASWKSLHLVLDRDLVWTGRTWTFTIDIKNRKPARNNVFIWNTELEMKFDFKWLHKLQTYDVLSSLKNNDKNEIECSCEIQFAVLNKMPTEDHVAFKHSASFRSGNQSTDWNIVQLNAIEDQRKGFVDDEGKVELEVNIFMSEPKSLGSVNRLKTAA